MTRFFFVHKTRCGGFLLQIKAKNERSVFDTLPSLFALLSFGYQIFEYQMVRQFGKTIMKKTYIALAVLLLAGCAKNPYQSAPQVNKHYVVAQSDSGTAESTPVKAEQGKTRVRLHRADQWTLVPFERTCPLFVRVDDKIVAALQFNEYVDLNLTNGKRDVKVSLACTLTGRSATTQIDANGTPQEYETDSGWYGQLRLWRTK